LMSRRGDADDPVEEAERAFALLSARLLDAIGVAVGPWVIDRIRSRLPDGDWPEDEVATAAQEVTTTVTSELAALFEQEVDQQATTPLSILRGAPVRVVTEVLERRGVPAIERDAGAIALHPDDPYDVTPGGFVDLSEEVHQAGLMWGAAKAHLHLRRHAGSHRD
jgi:hypothetical protein